jgi:drug/metabolite transporter (DMT)-like permease
MSSISPAEALPPSTAGQARLDARAVSVMTLLCLIWGIQQVMVKWALAGGLPPALQSGLRSAIAALLVMGWVGLREGGGGVAELFTWRSERWAGLLIALLFGGEFLVLYNGLAYTSASRAVIFLYTAPFFVALGVWLFIPSEPLRGVQLAGLLFAFLGVATAFADERTANTVSLHGDGLVLLAAVMWAAVTVLIKSHRGLRHLSAAKVLFYQLAGSAVLLCAVALERGEWRRLTAVTPRAWLALAYQSVVVAFASYLAWFWLIRHYPVGRLSAFSFLTPIFGLFAGILLLGEPASPALAFALLLVVAGLTLVNRPLPREGK